LRLGFGAPARPDDPAPCRARAIHDRVITLDTHVDISPANFQLGKPNYKDRLPSQVNIPKMEEGDWTPRSHRLRRTSFPPRPMRARQQAIEKFEAIHRLARR
jgi:membrane dipeptidase